MANLCSNRLIVSGEPTEIGRLLEAIPGVDDEGNELLFSFERLVPTPPEFIGGGARSAQAEELLAAWLSADEDKQYRLIRTHDALLMLVMKWHEEKPDDEIYHWTAGDWRVHNWGCRYSPSNDSIWIESSDDGRSRTIDFGSSAAPPIPILLALAERFPRLRLQMLYSEPDDDIGGSVLCENGRLVEHIQPNDTYGVVKLFEAVGWGESDSWLAQLGED